MCGGIYIFSLIHQLLELEIYSNCIPPLQLPLPTPTSVCVCVCVSIRLISWRRCSCLPVSVSYPSFDVRPDLPSTASRHSSRSSNSQNPVCLITGRNFGTRPNSVSSTTFPPRYSMDGKEVDVGRSPRLCPPFNWILIGLNSFVLPFLQTNE